MNLEPCGGGGGAAVLGEEGVEGLDQFGRVIEYLVNSRGIDKSRIRTIEGPKKDQLSKALWITPQGAAPPTP